MGCKYACTCSGICPGCRTYEPEEYYGHAEDIAAQARGYENYEDEVREDKE